jgi:hypothetical protein
MWSEIRGMCLRLPRPKGEGGPKGRVRGAKILLFTPHPVLRTTLSLRARDLSQTFSDLDSTCPPPFMRGIRSII